MYGQFRAEEGGNSDWLLPNRLYDSIAYGAVPIGLKGVEMGCWLARNDVGVVVEHPVAEIIAMLSSLTEPEYNVRREKCLNLDIDLVVHSRRFAATLVESLR